MHRIKIKEQCQNSKEREGKKQKQKQKRNTLPKVKQTKNRVIIFLTGAERCKDMP